MKNGDAGLCAAPMPPIESVATLNEKGKFSRRCLQVVAAILLSLLIVVPDLSRVHSQDARHAPPGQTKTELATAARDSAVESPINSLLPKVAKPDIVLPDIFIPVPADLSAPVAEKRNF